MLRQLRNTLTVISSLYVFLGIASAALAAGPEEGGPGISATSIKLGGSIGLTGPGAAQCGPMSDGLVAWFKQVNAQGGVNGRTIEYSVLDDGLDATRATANVKRLVEQDNVFALMGACSGAANGAMVPYAEAQGVPYVAPYGGTIAQVVPHKNWVFSTFALYETQIAAMVSWAFTKHGAGSVVGLSYTETPLWDSQVVKTVNDHGGKYLGLIIFKIGQPSFASEVLRIKSQNPDYLLFNGSATDAARLVKEMARIGYRPNKLILSTGVMADPGYVAALGPDVNFANDLSAAASPFVLASDPAVADCAKALGVAQKDLSSFQIYGCSAGQIMVAALNVAGKSPTRDKLKAALTSDFNAVVPALAGGKATSSADNILSHQLLVVGVASGQLTYIQPQPVLAPVISQ